MPKSMSGLMLAELDARTDAGLDAGIDARGVNTCLDRC